MFPSIETSVRDIMTATWDITEGRVVPKTDDIVMRNGGRKIDATYAYADLADSSTIAQYLDKEVAAKIIRAFVNSATRILRHYGGEIRSFDGDRVMAIFIGERKNWNAVRSALAIHSAVVDVIRPAIENNWDWSNTSKQLYRIGHRVGIDTGESLVVRGGARDNNDLISIGGAPNIAAKLSDLKSGHATYITKRVYDELDDDLLTHPETGRFWSRLPTAVTIGGVSNIVYGSNTRWEV
ncbi:adenylate cyclase [Williamsia sp. 1138]|uniref:adenylate/guanylate cyclase domain-containing protein n=1 Tax=Williamsia sp. 1138 TaxID=1903117 RepID=UPI000A0FB151|nr:adenylate/guanylate cyclase domain-containing protein [Williamsia sp. 1138]OZG29802.1 adenylate cyclase [Williamsia sp. 1138]